MSKLFLAVVVAIMLIAGSANAEDCIVIQPDGSQVTVNCQSVTASIQDVLSLQQQIDELKAILEKGGTGYAGGLPAGLPPRNDLPDMGPGYDALPNLPPQDRLPDMGKR